MSIPFSTRKPETITEFVKILLKFDDFREAIKHNFPDEITFALRTQEQQTVNTTAESSKTGEHSGLFSTDGPELTRDSLLYPSSTGSQTPIHSAQHINKPTDALIETTHDNTLNHNTVPASEQEHLVSTGSTQSDSRIQLPKIIQRKYFIMSTLGLLACIGLIAYFYVPGVVSLGESDKPFQPISKTNMNSLQTAAIPAMAKNHESENNQVSIFPSVISKEMSLSSNESPFENIAMGTTTMTPRLKKFIQKKRKIHVDSFDAYQLAMANIPLSHEAIVKISITPTLKWPQNSTLDNSEKITKLYLRGPFTVNSIINILNQTKNLRVLHLNNKRNNLCSTNEGKLTRSPDLHPLPEVALPRLKNMVLVGLSVCKAVYGMLSRQVELGNLVNLEIRNGVVNEKNEIHIRQVMQISNVSLTSINFGGSSWATSLTSKLQVTLANVKRLRMDIIPATNSTFKGSYLGKDFHRVFPNLQTFLSGNGYISLMDVHEMYNSDKLTHLEFGVAVDNGGRMFALDFLRKMFPLLQTTVIRLYFPSCDFNGKKPELLGLGTVLDTLSSLKVTSNCKMLIPAKADGNRKQSSRMELHEWTNGEFVFTFNTIVDANVS